MKQLAGTALLLFFSLPSFSQGNFVKGYIITQNNDTLVGEVRLHPKKEIENCIRITFKDALGGQKTYKPDKISGYGCSGHHYISMKFQDEMSFYRIRALGKIRLLEIIFETMIMNEVSFKSEYYIFKEGDREYTKLKENKTKKQLKEFMKDKLDVLDKFDDDTFSLEKTTEVINNYNDWAKKQG